MGHEQMVFFISTLKESMGDHCISSTTARGH